MKPPLTPQELAAYEQNAQIHAAVHAVWDIVQHNCMGPPRDTEQFFHDLIRFFANFDKARTAELESLHSRLYDVLSRTSLPPMILTTPEK